MFVENKSSTDGTLKTNKNDDDLVHHNQEKLPFPKGATVMLISKFFETFTMYGMRAIMVLYFTQKLGFDNDTATIIYHLFSTVSFFSCVLGAIVSDGWLGKFRTIMYVSSMYAAGSVLLTFGTVSMLPIPEREIALTGLFLVAIGCGCVKPCYQAIGGDQFKLPDQDKQMLVFFSLFSMMVKAGTLAATAITPALRQDVQCFGESDCYPLAFGVPGFMMIFSFVIFLAGKPLYVITAPTGNMAGQLANCVGYGLKRWFKEHKSNPKDHWLDYAEDKYGKTLIRDTKCVLNVMFLFIPLPLYWTLFELQGSRWTIQATQMNGDIGFYTIKPDQMQLISPLLIIILVPTYQWVLYPFLAKIGISRPLQKLTIGGLLAGTAVLISGFVELKIADSYAIVPLRGQCQLRIYNGQQCDYFVETESWKNGNAFVPSLEMYQQNVRVKTSKSIAYTMYAANANHSDCPTYSGFFNLRSREAISYFVDHSGVVEFQDKPQKARLGDPVVRVLVNSKEAQRLEIFDDRNDNRPMLYHGNASHIGRVRTHPSLYDIVIDGATAATVELKQGSVSTVLVIEIAPNQYRSNVVVVTQPNTVHMIWQIPQYITIALGGAMYVVIGMSFTYSEGPQNMKAVMQSVWLLTVAFGHVFDIVIVGAKFFESQANEYFLFAGLMYIDMMLFSILARRYKPIKTAD